MILYALSIVVRYLPSLWHDIEDGDLDNIRALIEHYLVIVDNVLPRLAVERIADEKCDIRQRHQISKAREIAIGSDLLLAMRRYLAVDSIFVWPKSTRTASISPVPFKMWRAFVRRKDSMPYFSGSSPASETQSLSRRLICLTVIG